MINTKVTTKIISGDIKLLGNIEIGMSKKKIPIKAIIKYNNRFKVICHGDDLAIITNLGQDGSN